VGTEDFSKCYETKLKIMNAISNSLKKSIETNFLTRKVYFSEKKLQIK